MCIVDVSWGCVFSKYILWCGPGLDLLYGAAAPIFDTRQLSKVVAAVLVLSLRGLRLRYGLRGSPAGIVCLHAIGQQLL